MGGKLSVTKRWRRRRERNNYYITPLSVRGLPGGTGNRPSYFYPSVEPIQEIDTDDELYETLPTNAEQEVDTEEPEAVYLSIPPRDVFERGGSCRTSQTNSEDSGVEAMSHNCPFLTGSSNGHCTCDSSSHETNSQFVEFMVEVFQPLICDTIRADEISRHMDFIANRKFRSRDNPKKAMGDLLKCIRNSKEPGKWRMFLDALRLTEHEYIYKLVTGRTEKDHSLERRVLELYTEELKRNINLKEIIDHLFENRVINELDKQNIEARYREYGEIEATDLLIDKVSRRAEDWNRIFIDVLRKCGNPEMADLIAEATVVEDSHSCESSDIHQTETKKVIGGHNAPLAAQVQCQALTDSNGQSGRYITRKAPSVLDVKPNSPSVEGNERKNPLVDNVKTNSPSVGVHDSMLTPDRQSDDPPTPCAGTLNRNAVSECINHLNQLAADKNHGKSPSCSGESSDTSVWQEVNEKVSSDRDMSSIETDEVFNTDYKRWIYITLREDALLKEVKELHAEKSRLDAKHSFSSQKIEKYIPILRFDKETNDDDNMSCGLDDENQRPVTYINYSTQTNDYYVMTSF